MEKHCEVLKVLSIVMIAVGAAFLLVDVAFWAGLPDLCSLASEGMPEGVWPLVHAMCEALPFAPVFPGLAGVAGLILTRRATCVRLCVALCSAVIGWILLFVVCDALMSSWSYLTVTSLVFLAPVLCAYTYCVSRLASERADVFDAGHDAGRAGYGGASDADGLDSPVVSSRAKARRYRSVLLTLDIVMVAVVVLGIALGVSTTLDTMRMADEPWHSGADYLGSMVGTVVSAFLVSLAFPGVAGLFLYRRVTRGRLVVNWVFCASGWVLCVVPAAMSLVTLASPDAVTALNLFSPLVFPAVYTYVLVGLSRAYGARRAAGTEADGGD